MNVPNEKNTVHLSSNHVHCIVNSVHSQFWTGENPVDADADAMLWFSGPQTVEQRRQTLTRQRVVTEALALIADGKVRVDDLITHRMPLADVNRAIETVMSGEGLKVVLEP